MLFSQVIGASLNSTFAINTLENYFLASQTVFCPKMSIVLPVSHLWHFEWFLNAVQEWMSPKRWG